LGVAVAVVASGCKSPENLETIHGVRPPKIQEPPPQPPIPPEITSGVTNGLNIPLPPYDVYSNYVAHPEILADDTVHFDFDKSAVKTSEKPKVEAVADYLKANAAFAIRIEGNCDERGTEEYNRALGERRALSLREELVRLGVAPSRVVTITYGQDRPVDPGHNEEAWRKNRRGDFVVLEPPGK
jgi:peptidoglycan-associated lipoprotein